MKGGIGLQIQGAMDTLQRDIFAYKTDNIPAQLSAMMTAILEAPAFDINDMQKIRDFNLLLQLSLQALQNQDYLLLADLIEFRIKPFLYNYN